jgi:hypothetical protein
MSAQAIAPPTGVYLFCLAGPAALGVTLEGAGIDGRHLVETKSMGDIVAVVSETELDEFMEPEGDGRMRTVEWLAPRAIRHEQVVEQVAASGPVLPVRLGTVFSSEVKLADAIARHHDGIVEFFERVRGREEWAVQGFLRRDQAVDARFRAALASLPPAPPRSSGIRYMQERRLKAEAEAGLQAWLRETARRLWSELGTVASSAVERTVLPPTAEQPLGEMVFNWALLIPGEQVSRLHRTLARFGDELVDSGLSLRESGAWPPYSFAPALDAGS